MKKTRALLLALATVLVFVSLTSSVAAIDHIEGTEEIVILPISELPEVIDREEAIARGYVARLKNEETDMHSVIFQNSDGTKSLYMFASPVKYIDSNGNVKDKRTTLSQTASGYATADNDVQLSFGTNPTANVAYLNDSINITPVSATSVTGFSQNNTMIYNGAFGMNTMLYYTPLLSGVKSTIILRSRGDENVFSFNVDAGDLTAQKDEDGVVSLLNTDGEKLFKFGIYTVTDAVGNRIEGEMQLSANENGVYTVSAAVDTEFLNSESTVYPVAVEPTFTLNTSTAIDDAVIYSLKPNKNYGAYNYHNVGYLTDYGTGQLLVKFPGLNSNSTYLNLDPDQIQRAELCIYTASSNTHETEITAFRQNIYNWSETAVTWTTFHSAVNVDHLLELTSVEPHLSGGKTVVLNLTSMAKECISSAPYRQGGILVRNWVEDSTQVYTRDYCSTEYANSHNNQYMPHLIINYTTSVETPTVNIDILYDAAFRTRCTTIYGNTSTAVSSRLTSLMQPAQAKYLDTFNINIEYTYRFANSYIETSNCSNKNNLNSLCNCYSYCVNNSVYHHTNQTPIMNAIENGNPDTKLIMFMTGHKTCESETSACNGDYSVMGVSYNSLYKIGIFYTDISNTTRNSHISSVIAHELGHQYGVEDHYYSYDALKRFQSPYCIWGQNRHWPEVYENMTICDYCAQTIINNFSKYDH